MSTNSDIEWTDASWNPTSGCSPKSPGCAHCYAEIMSRRQQAMAQADIAAKRNPGAKRFYLDVIGDNGRWNGQVNPAESKLTIPLSWKKPRKIFVNSMSDLFWGEPDDLEFAHRHGVKDPQPVPFEFIDKVFAVMALCPQHTFQVLTKRPARMAEYLATYTARKDRIPYSGDPIYEAARHVRPSIDKMVDLASRVSYNQNFWPLSNVWIGTSTENQKTADERIPHLVRCLAAVRFISAEPLLDPIDLSKHIKYLDLVITGGESGPGARPCDVDWIRNIGKQCQTAGVAWFNKQLGADAYTDHTCTCGLNLDGHWKGPAACFACAGRLPLKDKKGGDMEEWPEDLRVRQMPNMVESQA